MKLPEIPYEVWQVAHDGDFYNRTESVRLSVEAAWPHLYAVALRHAAERWDAERRSTCAAGHALRLMADEADSTS